MKKVLSVVLVMGMLLSLAACGGNKSELKFGQVQYAAHGTKAFAVTTVVMDGDKIAIAYIDEYQVLAKDGAVMVPNMDKDFGANFADEAKGLASKRVNNDFYSNNMKEAGSTISLVDNYTAIEKFAEGKTIAELEKAINGKSAEEVVDAVSSCTLVDTLGYIESIIEAAKAAK